MLSELIQANP